MQLVLTRTMLPALHLCPSSFGRRKFLVDKKEHFHHKHWNLTNANKNRNVYLKVKQLYLAMKLQMDSNLYATVADPATRNCLNGQLEWWPLQGVEDLRSREEIQALLAAALQLADRAQ